MKFGIHYSLGVGFSPTGEDYLHVAQRAEELGYHSVWLGDHIVIPEKIAAPYPYTSDGSVGFARRTPWPDPFVLLSAIGARTRKIRLGTSVAIVPYRNPLHVAKAVATVDLVSNGRCLFGVGVGWLKEEFDALGEVFSERASRTREYLRIMKTMWQNELASFQGKYFSFSELHTLPLPVQKPHPPIIFGGETPAALKRVADLGDGWQPGPIPLDTLRECLTQLKTLMAERGRNFSQLTISQPISARELQENPNRLAELEALGIHELILFMGAPDVNATLAEVEDAARAFIP